MNNQDRENPRILLAIPVFNEQEYIHAVLDQVAQYIDDILVIDDGSTDRSRLLGEETVFLNRPAAQPRIAVEASC